MEINELKFRLINPMEHREKVLSLLQQLNPKLNMKTLNRILVKRRKTDKYICFALFEEEKLIGISSGSTLVRAYSEKQLELENVIIGSKIHSRGYGKYFMDTIKEWSLKNNYNSIGLNSYVQNSKSHKFYFNQGFKVLGFNFVNFLN